MIEFDVTAFLEDRNIPYKTRGKNIAAGWIGIKCLWCSDHSFHLGINLTNNGFNCWKCGEKGDAVKLVSEIEKCNRSMAYKITRQFLNLTAALEQQKRVKVYSEHIDLSELSQEIPLSHREYLNSRNFDPDYLIKKYHLLAGDTTGSFRYRIVAPIYLRRELVSLVGRDITNMSSQRYKALAIEKSRLSLKSTLYNIDNAQKRSVIVVEGITDVWRIGDDCVATFGTKFLADQVLLLKDYQNVFILFDPEEDAQKQASHLAMNLSGLIDHVEIISIDKNDPAEMSLQDVQYLRKELRL